MNLFRNKEDPVSGEDRKTVRSFPSRMIRFIILVLIMVGFLEPVAGCQPSRSSAYATPSQVLVQSPSPRQATNQSTLKNPTSKPSPVGQITAAETPEETGTIFLPTIVAPVADEWPMVAANPQRTSWTPEEVSGNVHIEWYRPIEAYIPQNVQIIASNGIIYVSSAKGLYALNAANGETVWRFDTEMPLGNSPAVAGGVVYVGGYDRKLHALNAFTGSPLWAFDGAKAGYDTNPLVVEGKVIAGNRDGYMYAVNAHGYSNQGQLAWKFKTGGPIHYSAAYKSGVIYFASNDNHAYALRVSDGALAWKSGKLPGDGYHSYWPVVYRDKVIFSASTGYRHNLDPGTRSVVDETGDPYDSYNGMQLSDMFFGETSGTLLGPTVPDQGWSNGQPIIDASRVTEYLENNPSPDAHQHKPWRRQFIILNLNDGSEYTFDSDGDGHGEYMPFAYWGTKSGNRYPPIVGADSNLYQGNVYSFVSDAQGRIMGWKFGTQYLSILQAQGAIAEPQAISAGGNLIYRSLCCDRVGDVYDIRSNGNRPQALWSYNLAGQAPGYDEMWTILPGWPRLQGWYKGVTQSVNGIYHNHGDQNPIVPYAGRLYTHRSNAIIVYGPGAALGKLPLVTINPSADDHVSIPTREELIERLEEEIQKMIEAGHLRPGYYNNGQYTNFKEFADYFENPGETLYTLAMAYPYISSQLQSQVRNYLSNEFQAYFDPVMYSAIGWAEGAPREALPLPPEVEAALPTHPKREASQRWSWQYPQHNFYAMWKYAQIFPQDAERVYDLAKSKIQVPIPEIATDEYLNEKTYEHNAYIAGYIGFLELQDLAGKAGVDSQLRTQVTNELNRLLELRATTFEKDSPWMDDRYHKRHMIIARNFIYLVPELGDYLNQHALSKVQAALNEYEYVAPYWFVSRFESVVDEGVMSVLYNSPALFQARAYILHQNRAELAKYLDVPAFERGDLFFIQNLVAAIEAD